MDKIKSKIREAENFLDNLDQKIFKYTEFRKLFTQSKNHWLKEYLSFEGFIELMLAETNLRKIVLEFPHRKEIRFIWGETTFLKFLTSLFPNSYFSHFSAMKLKGLTEQIPETDYINIEQKEKKTKNQALSQDSIDKAFQNKVRVSSNIAQYEGKRICILNGKNTKQLGVEECFVNNTEEIKVTDIERTLIDITVRPAYSGGINEVLKAFKNAKGKISTYRIAEYLKKINFTYPYHQSIGFLLEKAGHEKSQLEILKRIGFNFDFYLEYKMTEMEYSEEWRLFYPKNIKFTNLES